MPSFLSAIARTSPAGWTLANRRTGEVIASEIETAFDSATRRRGLLGRDGLPPGVALVIAPCPSIHTFFMRFPIDVVFAARDGRVVRVCRRVRAWRIAIGWGAFAAIETAAGDVDPDLRRGDYVALVRRSVAEPAVGGLTAAELR